MNDDINTKEIHVYMMNEYEWYASKWGKEETNEWYKKEFGLDDEDSPVEGITEVDINQEGMWLHTGNKKDIKALGEYDEIISTEKVNGMTKKVTRSGDLQRRDELVFKFTSYKDALKYYGDFEEPYCIATTEY